MAVTVEFGKFSRYGRRPGEPGGLFCLSSRLSIVFPKGSTGGGVFPRRLPHQRSHRRCGRRRKGPPHGAGILWVKAGKPPENFHNGKRPAFRIGRKPFANPRE